MNIKNIIKKYKNNNDSGISTTLEFFFLPAHRNIGRYVLLYRFIIVFQRNRVTEVDITRT